MGKFRKRLASRFERSADIRDLSGELRCQGLAQALTGLDQPVECLAVLPVELVHCPRRDRGLAQRLHALRLVSAPALLQPRGQCVARTGERCQRDREQCINIIPERALRHRPSLSHLHRPFLTARKSSATNLRPVPNNSEFYSKAKAESDSR